MSFGAFVSSIVAISITEVLETSLLGTVVRLGFGLKIAGPSPKNPVVGVFLAKCRVHSSLVKMGTRPLRFPVAASHLVLDAELRFSPVLLGSGFPAFPVWS